MNKLIIFSAIILFFPLYSHGQLGKSMQELRDQQCATVTLLNKDLYGLYKKKNIPAEAEDFLKQLEEVNILNLNLFLCKDKAAGNITDKFKKILEAPGGYQLIKSYNDMDNKQLIYVRTKNERISDLVVWNENPEWMDLVELRGSIQPGNVALLSKALNVNGLSSLSSLNPSNKSYSNYVESFQYDNMADMSRELSRMAEEMQKNMKRQFKSSSFSNSLNNLYFENLFDSLGNNFDIMGQYFDQMVDNLKSMENLPFSSVGNSIQISEKDGKTKIKIGTKNTEMNYIVDGIKFDGEEVTMPEKIARVNVVPDKNDKKKSYLVVVSRSPLGQFISYKNDMLSFKYDNHIYEYNLKKSGKPILYINGQLSDDFSVKGTDILQIRPVSEAEKKLDMMKGAEVIINTK